MAKSEMKDVAILVKSHRRDLVLESGSRAAVLMAKSDHSRDDAARESRYLRDARLPGASRRLPRVPEWIL
jgi:hypothetical protein